MYDLGQSFRINQENLEVEPKSVFTGQKYRIQILTERLIRFEYNELGKFVDAA